MANSSTLIEEQPMSGASAFLGQIRLYKVFIDTINTYQNIANAAPPIGKKQMICGLLMGSSTAVTISFGLSASIDINVPNVIGPHGMPMGNGIYLAGVMNYRIQMKANVACEAFIAVVESATIRV